MGNYNYGPISNSTERMSPAYDPITLKAVPRAGTVRINWKNDKIANDEELVARVHVHPNTFYREALYPSTSDIIGFNRLRNKRIVHNRKWKHVHDFILLPPSKNTELARLKNGKIEKNVTMLLQNSNWNIEKATKAWKSWYINNSNVNSVLNELEDSIYRFDGEGKIVSGKLKNDKFNFDEHIENYCE